MRTKAQVLKEIKILEEERLKLRDLTTDLEYKNLQDCLFKLEQKLNKERSLRKNQCWDQISELRKELDVLSRPKKFQPLPKVIAWVSRYFAGIEGSHEIYWHTSNGRFVIIREPGHLSWYSRGEQKYYGAEYQLYDTIDSGYTLGRPPHPHVYTWQGRMTKEMFKKFEELIVEKRKEG